MTAAMTRDANNNAAQVPRLLGAPTSVASTSLQNTTDSEQIYVLMNGSGSTAYFRVDAANTGAANTDNYIFNGSYFTITVPKSYYLNTSGTIRVARHQP